jgi:hypothetical protein
MNKDKGTRKVRGLCSTCGCGIHLWERIAHTPDGPFVVESGWDHDKSEHNTHPVPVPK